MTRVRQQNYRLIIALKSQSRPSFKPIYEDERLPYTTLNNIALLLRLLYIVAPMSDCCTRLFNRPTVLPSGSGQLVSQFSATS